MLNGLSAMSGVESKSCYIGQEAASKRDILSVRHPIEQGIVTEWGAMEKIWEYTFSQVLRLEPSSQTVLLADCPLNPKSNREYAMEIMFDSFSTQAVYMKQTAVLSLYASGRSTGLVLESGDGVTHAVPIHEGFSLEDRVQRLDVSGREVTQVLERQLETEDLRLESFADLDVLQDIKEKLCYVALDYESECQKPIQDVQAEYTLPDGSIITVGHARSQAAEAMFDPQRVLELEAKAEGVCEMAASCVNTSDIDLRAALARNIVLVRAPFLKWRSWHNEVGKRRS